MNNKGDINLCKLDLSKNILILLLLGNIKRNITQLYRKKRNNFKIDDQIQVDIVIMQVFKDQDQNTIQWYYDNRKKQNNSNKKRNSKQN